MNHSATILIVDDEERIRKLLSSILKMKGYNAIGAENGEEALRILENKSADAVLLDLMLPGLSGMEVFERIRKLDTNIPVIMITAYGSVPLAVEALKKGAYDFIEKPLDADKILVTIKNAVERSLLTRENLQLRQTILDRFKMVGVSPAMRKVFKQIDLLADKDCTVLITGETGTGKDLVARCLHNLSSRIAKPFVKINCAALPSDLVENELFGHVKGAFTGALQDKPGKFEVADGGTIFLDEVGEISPQVQAKLLQVLDEKTFSRLGEVAERQVNVRVIAATNKDLEKEAFREDLFYRLNAVRIHIPPLRERPEDIPELIHYYLPLLCEELSVPERKVTPEAIRLFLEYPWKGNVRELKQKLLEMLIYHDGEILDADYVQRWLPLPSREITSTEESSLRKVLQKYEREYIYKALLAHNWNIPATANYLKIERTNLYRKMRKLGIEKMK